MECMRWRAYVQKNLARNLIMASSDNRIYGLHPFCKKKIEFLPLGRVACIYSACLMSALRALALM